MAENITEYERISAAGHVFHSTQYSRPTKTYSTSILLGNGRLARISHIVTFAAAVQQESTFVI